MLIRWSFVLYALVACSLYSWRCSSAAEDVAVPARFSEVSLEGSNAVIAPDVHDAVLLNTQYTMEIPGTRGIVRLLFGVAILLWTIAYIWLVTYPKLMSKLQEFFMRAQQFTDVLAGEEPRSKAEYILKRIEAHAEENPEEVAMQAAGIVFGLLFMIETHAEENPEEVAMQAAGIVFGLLFTLWGLATLRKPRRIKLVGV
ncbi:hypothetical protein, conserved [Eimeria praecox]|uniref:Uncharacterized protein n=1 Tax=Eimeria praecox TaxID=51316 RepID=U6H7C3_9EIME|nr:hypothetical protein, conserved [Eimeria praecox]